MHHHSCLNAMCLPRYFQVLLMPNIKICGSLVGTDSSALSLTVSIHCNRVEPKLCYYIFSVSPFHSYYKEFGKELNPRKN